MSEKGIENHQQRYQNQQRNSENAGKHKVESHSGVRYHYPPSHHRRTQRHNSGTSTASTNSAATLSNLTNNKSGNKWDGRLIPSRVFVGNIPPNLVERDLGLLFCRFGKIRDVKIIPDSSRSKSYGFVTFFSEVDAKRAIQASLQQDAVMWGDRKLNVAPAVKRQNKNCPSIRASTESLFSLWTPRFGGTTYFSNPLHASTPALFQTEGTDTTGTQTLQPPPVVNANNNGMYKGSFFCRYPHQLPTPQYPHWSSSPTGAHYFMTPSFQPYVQNGNTPVLSPSAYSTAPTCNSGQDNLPMTSYHNEISVNVSTTTLDKSCEHHGSGSSLDSSGSSSNTITEGLSQLEVGEGEPEQPFQGKVDGNELAVQEDGSQQVYTSDNINNNNPVCQPLHQTAMICCAHHSCMMSPLPLPMVPAYHLGGQMSSTRSSCVSLNSPSAPPNSPGCYPTGTPFVPYGSNLPGVYNQPHYRPNSNPPRLQRWNSMDAGIYQHQDHASMLSHEMGWTRQVVLNDSYGSEMGLHYLPVRQQYPTISAFPCTAHGLVSPFCRSYDSINVLGQGQHYQHYGEQMEQINVSMTSLNCKK